MAQWSVGHSRNKTGNKNFPGSEQKSKHNLPEHMGHSKGSPKRKVYNHECIY
jgi:hypothetical protein